MSTLPLNSHACSVEKLLAAGPAACPSLRSGSRCEDPEAQPRDGTPPAVLTPPGPGAAVNHDASSGAVDRPAGRGLPSGVTRSSGLFDRATGSRPASIRALLRAATQRLHAAGLAHARHEAEWLLGQLIGAHPLELYLQERPIPEETMRRFFSQIEARAMGIPLQYLLGEAEFLGERFAVAPGVFIPRPETETVVEAALQGLRRRAGQLARPLRLLDVGTGSGCIAVTLARCLPTCVVVGLELSWEALRIAQENVLRCGLSSRVWLVQGRWAESLRGDFDGVLANPPYIPSAQVDHLPRDVRQEPRVSLDGGNDGMRGLCHLMAQAPRLVRPGGLLALECGEEHIARLLKQACAFPWVEAVSPIQDVAHRGRGILLHRRCDGHVAH